MKMTVSRKVKEAVSEYIWRKGESLRRPGMTSEGVIRRYEEIAREVLGGRYSTAITILCIDKRHLEEELKEVSEWLAVLEKTRPNE